MRSLFATSTTTTSASRSADPSTDAAVTSLSALGPPEAGERLLEVTELSVEFRTQLGTATAVNGASFHVSAGETLGVIGESGSGKSVTAQAVMGILDTPPARIVGGRIDYRGTDLLALPESQRRLVRARKIAMVFQDALSALNPVLTIGFQIGEQLRVHQGLSRKDSKRKVIELLDLVRIPGAERRVNHFPHQFSGGMRQRVMIAMSLALDPELLIADEPTTALDVTVQAQVMTLLREIQQERTMGLILITHDMGVVAEVADRVAVMYAGRIVEQAPVRQLYRSPAHPYTRALLRSVPRVDLKGQQLEVIPGLPPSLTSVPHGCAFHPRCAFARDDCLAAVPPLVDVDADHRSACLHWTDLVGPDPTGPKPTGPEPTAAEDRPRVNGIPLDTEQTA